MTIRRRSFIAAHIAAVLFGLTGIFGALIHSDATMITLGRAAFAVIGLGLFAPLLKSPLFNEMSLYKIGIFLVTGLLLSIHWITFFIAVKVGGVAVATLGFASFPAFITLVDIIIFREKVSLSELSLLGLVTIGLILVTPSFNFGDSGTIGLLWGLASGFAFAMLAVVNGKASGKINAMQAAFWQNAVVVLLVAPFAYGYIVDLTVPDWTYLALLGIFCTGLSQYLFVKSLEGLNARTSGMIIALEPVYAIACAWWLFHEQPSLRMLCGAALIIFAIIRSARAKKPA